MRIAALYDIHGNLPALEAVLGDVLESSVDEILVGGDVCPGPMCDRVLSRLLELDRPVRFLRGNGDREVLEAASGRAPDSIPEAYREAILASTRQLAPDSLDLMREWPASIRRNIDGLGEVLFCHATPESDQTIFTRRTPARRLSHLFEGTTADLVVCGHTHMQFELSVSGMHIVNAGSVGMPFGRPGAYWLLLGPEPELKRTDYDLAVAAREIRASGGPLADAFAERSVLRPPSEEDMLNLYARADEI